jgi:hypothetical protein
VSIQSVLVLMALLEVGGDANPGGAPDRCREAAEVTTLLKILRDSNWRKIAAENLEGYCGGKLEVLSTDPTTGEVSLLGRRGSTADSREQCGETYWFDKLSPNAPWPLRAVSFFQTEPSRGAALAMARSYVELLGPPPEAGRSGHFVIDGEPLTERIADYSWDVDGETSQDLEVSLQEIDGSFRVLVYWRRYGATP